MTPVASQRLQDAPVEGRRPHLVIKRGHHGRYRFALMTDHARITGEVAVEAGGDRNVARAHAVAKIAALAQTLSASLADEKARWLLDSAPYQCETDRDDVSSSESEPILGGGYNGQI